MKRVAFSCACIPIYVILSAFCQALILPQTALAEDLFNQEKKLVRLEESWGGQFGSSISMDGDTIVVGATDWKRTETCCSYGAVFIYYRNYGGTNNWGEVKKIAPTDITNRAFGASVAISGDILTVSYHDTSSASITPATYIYSRNLGGTDNWGLLKKITNVYGSMTMQGDVLLVGAFDENYGAVYIFQRDFGGVNNWGQVKKIVPSDSVYSDRFGVGVAISGTTIIVGAPTTANSASPPGKAFIFERNFGGIDNWGEVKKIVPSDGENNDRFGQSVSIHGDTVVIGSYLDDDNGIDSGSAYIFERNFGGIDNWGEVKKIVPSDGESNDRFGQSVSIHNDTLIVGSPNDDDNGDYSGSVYAFYRNEGGGNYWGQVKKIISSTDSTNGIDEGFGQSVFLLEDSLVVASPSSDKKGYMMGMAYKFERNNGGIDNWGQAKWLFPVDTRYVAGDNFGKSVSIDVDTIAVGARLDDEGGSSSGAVYVLERNLLGTSNWGQYRKQIISVYATNPSDYYGCSVSASSGTIITGAYGDDDKGTDAGAAYIIARDNEGSDLWGYDTVKKLVAEDGVASDYFGYVVAINGDTAVVGAYGDDDNGTGSGSAYIFQRDQGGLSNWGHVKKLLPDDGVASDYFGFAVAISGDTVAIGAHQDDDHGSGSGSIYIFERDHGGLNNWGQVKKITPPDGAASDYFGRALSLDTNVLAAGAYGDDDNGSSSGSAYIFQRDQGGPDNWGLVKKVKPTDGAASDNFGWAVSVSSDVVAVGAYLDDDAGSASGSVYIFKMNQGGTDNWGEVQKITASDGYASDNFGEALSIDGDTMVIGASLNDDYGASSGSAYVLSFAPDIDGDGLSDLLEDQMCTQSTDADSDDDGISDGEEDINRNGVVDVAETNPCDIDSDDDGLQDGTELGLIIADVEEDTDLSVFQADTDPSTTTNQLVSDSDGDGMLDGDEDFNHNGSWDVGETAANVASGDFNLDNTVDLVDLITVLRIISNHSISETYDNSADTDGDQKIGLTDGLYIIHSLETNP